MGQQHRARVKRKRRKAYLKRKKATRKVTPAKARAKKQSAAAE